MNSKLLPCPFCGGEPRLDYMYCWPYRVYCTQCGVFVKSAMIDKEGIADVIERWNRRVNAMSEQWG